MLDDNLRVVVATYRLGTRGAPLVVGGRKRLARDGLADSWNRIIQRNGLDQMDGVSFRFLDRSALHGRVPVGKQPRVVLAPRPDVECPVLEVIVALQLLAEETRRLLGRREHSVGDNVLD